MTSNPHPGHGLWVERNALPGQDFPHALRRMDGEKFRQYGYIGIAEHLARILGEQP